MKIYAISDQHGFLPDIPPCDLLIVAGDNCPDYPPGARDRVGTGPQTQRQAEWFLKTWLPWRHRQPAKRVLVTWGNHDYCGEMFHNAGGARIGMPGVNGGHEPETIAVVDGLVTDDSGLKIWLTPWSSQFRDWAFMAEDWRLLGHYKAIPAGIDILVSHQPPAGYGDIKHYDLETGKAGWLGSQALLETMVRVKPRAVVCGHIHSGYGISDVDICEKHGDVGTACECKTFTTTRVYNVAVVNEQYKLVNPPTEIIL